MIPPVENDLTFGRRDFLRMAVATSSCAIPILAAAFNDTCVASTPRNATHFVFDRRVGVPSKIDFYRKLSPSRSHSFTGDITPIWVNVLEPLWHQGRVATAGLTRHTEFYLLRTLALEHGYSVSDKDEYPDHVFWILSPEQMLS